MKTAPESNLVRFRRCLRAAIVFLLVLGPGCREKEGWGDKIEIVSGTNQKGLPGEELRPLVVRVFGPKSLDLLGRQGTRRPAADIPVTFEVEIPEEPPEEAMTADAAAPGEAGAGSVDGEDGEDGGGPAPVLPPWPVISHLGPPPPRVEQLPSEENCPTFRTVWTDEDGYARVGIRLGSRNGRWNIQAELKENTKEDVRFRVFTGIETEPGPIESVVGEKVPIRMWLKRLSDPSDLESIVPMEDRDILFRMVGSPEGVASDADLKDKRNDTDENGLRETEITLGDVPGYYYVLAEIFPHEGDDPIAALTFTILAMDWVEVGMKLIVGILLFVIGVRLLGRGFLLLTSRFMHLPTGPWARNRFQGYLGGIASGAVFESSSLVSSYLVSFANGGIVTAAGAIGLILGANLGGTMLPQIVALEVGELALPLLALGIFLVLVPRRIEIISWGWVLLGAGLALAGWRLLDDGTSLAALSEQLRAQTLGHGPDAGAAFSAYAPRFLSYFVLGAGVAFVLRTSNLLVVLSIALAIHGIIGIAPALALVLGANFGSAAMIFLRSLTKRQEARRVAFSNLLVHVFGCAGAIVLCLVTIEGKPLFGWVVQRIVPDRILFAAPAGVGQHIAMAHTLYNFLAGIVFLACPRCLLSVVDRVFRPQVVREEVKPSYLDGNLITVPALALRQATEETVYMTEICRKTVAEAFDSFRYNDLDLSEQVVRREEVIASMHRDITRYLAAVGENQLSNLDASHLEILQTAASCLLRIGELGERYRDVSTRKIEERVTAAEEVDRDLNEVYDLVMAQFENVLNLLRKRDPKTEENTVKMMERMAKYSSRVEALWRQRVGQADGNVTPLAVHIQTVVYLEAFGLLFQIAEQLAHIAERMRTLRPDRL